MPPYIEPADPLDVLSQLNELVQENNDEDICVVCQDILDNGQEQIFYLPECGHGYHTNCIMTWFRAGNDACPCCGNKGINSICQNRLWYTDIGISKAFDSAFNKMNSISNKPKIKQAQVLEINNGKVTILC